MQIRTAFPRRASGVLLGSVTLAVLAARCGRASRMGRSLIGRLLSLTRLGA
jgi:hypothetical protein